MKNAKEILVVVLALHMSFEKAKEDGKIDIRDVQEFIGPITLLPAAVQDAQLAIDELKNGTEEDRKALHAELAEMYDIADDKIEAKVEAAIEFLMAIGKFAGVLAA